MSFSEKVCRVNLLEIAFMVSFPKTVFSVFNMRFFRREKKQKALSFERSKN